MMRAEELRLTKALGLFREWLQACNYSVSTLENYTRDVRRLADFLGDPQLGGITKLDLIRAQADLCRSMSPRSAGRYVSAWRAMFRFCRSELDLAHDPSAKLRLPRFASPPHVYLVADEVTGLLGAIDQGTVKGIRDHALITTLINTGLRVGELRALRIGDVNLGAQTLRIRDSKTRRGGILPLNRNVVFSLGRWLAVRPSAPGDFIFIRTDGRCLGKPLARMSIGRIIRSLLQTAGIERPEVTPHKLRHTFAMMLLEARRPDGSPAVTEFELQELMRHQSANSTRHYIEISAGRLQRAVDQLPEDHSEQLQIFSVENVFSS